MSNYTKGPWTWAYSNDTGPDDDYFVEFFEVTAEDYTKIAQVEEQEDARLISAAPDLLKAAQTIMENLDGMAGEVTAGYHESIIAPLRDAIAKATGEQS